MTCKMATSLPTFAVLLILSTGLTLAKRESANAHGPVWSKRPGGAAFLRRSNFLDWPAQIWHDVFGNGMPLDGFPYPPPYPSPYPYPPQVYAPAPAPAPPSVIMLKGREAPKSNNRRRTANAAPQGRSAKGRSIFDAAMRAPFGVAKTAMDAVLGGFGSGFPNVGWPPLPVPPSYLVPPPLPAPAAAPPPQIMVIRGREAPKEEDAPQGARLYGVTSSRTCLFAFCMDLAEVHKYTADKREQCFCHPQRCECNPESAIAPMKVYDGQPQDHSEPLELMMSCNAAMPCIPTPPCPRAKSCRNNGDGYSRCVCYAPGACSCWQEDDGASGGSQPRFDSNRFEHVEIERASGGGGPWYEEDNIQIEKSAPQDDGVHSGEHIWAY